LLSAIAFTIYLELSVFVFLRCKKSLENFLAAVTFFMLGIVSLCHAYIYSAPDAGAALVFLQAGTIFVPVTLPMLVHFLYLLPRHKKTNPAPLFLVMLYLPAIVFSVRLFFFMGLVKGFANYNGSWFEIINPVNAWDIAYIMFYYLYIFAALALLIKLNAEAEILKEKRMARLMTAGFIASFTLMTFIQYIQPFILERPLVPRISHICMLFFIVSVWYSIIRYGFLGRAPVSIEANPLYKKLSRREKMIVPPLCEGLTNREIGSIFNISEGTVRKHVENIYKKTGITSKVELIGVMYLNK